MGKQSVIVDFLDGWREWKGGSGIVWEPALIVVQAGAILG